MDTKSESDSGKLPEVLVHSHASTAHPDMPSVTQQNRARVYFKSHEMHCTYRPAHEHDGHPLHHHHSLDCLVDAGRIQGIEELLPLRLDLAQAQQTLEEMAGMVQRDAYTRQVMGPLVDLIVLWQTNMRRQEFDNPEKIIAEFAVEVAQYMGLLDEWTKVQEEKFTLDDSDASR